MFVVFVGGGDFGNVDLEEDKRERWCGCCRICEAGLGPGMLGEAEEGSSTLASTFAERASAVDVVVVADG